MRSILIVVSLSILVTSPAPGVEVSLRPKVHASGTLIRLGDVADLAAVGEDEARQLAAMPLIPSPRRGLLQYLAVADIRDMLAAKGVDMAGVKFVGANTVEISGRAEAQSASRPRISVSAPGGGSRETALLVKRIEDHLRETTGHDHWAVKLDVDAETVARLDQSNVRLNLTGGRAPWTGRQRFELTSHGSDTSTSVFANVQRLELAIIATQALEQGDLVRQIDIERTLIAGALPAKAVLSADQIVGKETTGAIRPGAVILSNQIRAPIIVRRGQRVSVRAKAAGVSVRTFATAQQDGSLGDLVKAQSLTGKDVYMAQVSGDGELEIMAAGAVAADLARSTRR